MKNTLLGAAFLGAILYFNQESAPTPAPVPTPVFEEGTQIRISFSSFKVIDGNHIGDSWSYGIAMNEQAMIPKNTLVDLSNREGFELESTAVEDDPSYDDVGSVVTRITPDNYEQILQNGEIVEIVEVREGHGPSAGRTATCEFRYRVSRN